MNLQELKTLGVRELSVSNGQAVAVNPYQWRTLSRSGLKRAENRKYLKFHKETFALPPLPCAESVKEGTYPIDRFSEQQQELNEDDLWTNCTEDVYQHLWAKGIACRLCLVLSEPVAESEPKFNPEKQLPIISIANSMFSHVEQIEEKCSAGCIHYTGGEVRHTKGCFFYPDSLTEKYDKMEKEMRVEVAEKPEGESYTIDFGSHLRCKVNICNGIFGIQAAMDGWGNPIPLSEIITTKHPITLD